MNLAMITYLIVFPDGDVWYGYKKDEYTSHSEILTDMQKINQEFRDLTKYYNLDDPKEQIKLYKELVSEGAIVYHAWSTCLKEPTSDADVYLPGSIYKGQLDLFVSIKDQFNINNLLILNKLVEEEAYTDLKQLSYLPEDMNVDNLILYLEEHLVKQKIL